MTVDRSGIGKDLLTIGKDYTFKTYDGQKVLGTLM